MAQMRILESPYLGRFLAAEITDEHISILVNESAWLCIADCIFQKAEQGTYSFEGLLPTKQEVPNCFKVTIKGPNPRLRGLALVNELIDLIDLDPSPKTLIRSFFHQLKLRFFGEALTTITTYKIRE